MASKSDDPNQDDQYFRRIDRTPERASSNLARLSSDDRNKIYGLRSAFGNTISKLQQLQESNDEKDLIIERERQLRKELMESKLVDMYSDPAVNEELNSRLPRAAKERMYSLNQTPHTSKRRGRAKRSVRSEDEQSYSDEELRCSHKHRHSYPGAMAYPPMFAGNPGYYGWPSAPPMMHHPAPAQHSTPMMHHPAPAQHSTPVVAPYPCPVYQSVANPGSTTWGPPKGSSPNSGDASVSQGKSEKTTEADVIKAASMLSADSKERQLARLLHEIDVLKDQNRKMSSELADSIAECKRLEVENQLRSVSSEEQISSKVSVLIQEIYCKQKQRDQAMMGRLKLANDERDKALVLAKALFEGQMMQDVLSDEEEQGQAKLKGTLSRESMMQQTSSLLDNISSSVHKSRAQHAQRLEALTTERDTAQQKVQQLEIELLRLQREVDEMLPTQEELLRVKRQLSTTQEERNLSLSKLRTLEEENGNLKIYYGLHKSLSKEQSWKEQYNNSLNQMQELIAQRDGNVLDAQKQTNRLQDIIRDLSEERDMLSQQMEKLQATETEHQRTNEKLQRHVSVLQKKLKKISQVDHGTV
ncbi:mirror-image polydactyly gene 1 protein-like [Watersipora subatra]|uniref:mirror-image polydactyly gene 1 protein-like n=1 Tax=Watersipora subatra TaxID=2589382 RepID=UPI00355B59E8